MWLGRRPDAGSSIWSCWKFDSLNVPCFIRGRISFLFYQNYSICFVLFLASFIPSTSSHATRRMIRFLIVGLYFHRLIIFSMQYRSLIFFCEYFCELLISTVISVCRISFFHYKITLLQTHCSCSLYNILHVLFGCFRKIAKSGLLASSCLSVCISARRQWTTRLQLNRFSWNFDIWVFFFEYIWRKYNFD